jgi:hypothetical protein
MLAGCLDGIAPNQKNNAGTCVECGNLSKKKKLRNESTSNLLQFGIAQEPQEPNLWSPCVLDVHAARAHVVSA